MGYKKGSYTVEASLLMGIILSVIVGMIYLGFYLHDTAYIQAASHEAACAAVLHSGDDTKPAASLAQILLQGKMAGAKNMQSKVSEGKNSVAIYMEGTILIPGLSQYLFGKNQLDINSAVKLTTKRPSDTIQKIRQTAKLIRRIQGN